MSSSPPPRPLTPFPTFEVTRVIPAPAAAPSRTPRNYETPRNDEMDQLRLLNDYLKNDLDNVKKQLEKKDAQVKTFQTLLDKKSKMKIEEIETQRVEESLSYEAEISSLKQLIMELENAREYEHEVNRWNRLELNQLTAMLGERTKDCQLFAHQVQKLGNELETKSRKIERLEEERKNAQGEMRKWLGAMPDFYGNMLKSVEESASVQEVVNSSNEGPADRTDYSFPLCEICGFDFDESPQRTPRVLLCGHTVCEECAIHLAAPSASNNFPTIFRFRQQPHIKIRCPFDRREMVIVSTSVRSLPKNYTVLECIARNRRN